MDVKDLFGLTGKNVAITGSASGMNRAATDGEDVFEAPLMVFRSPRRSTAGKPPTRCAQLAAARTKWVLCHNYSERKRNW